MAEFKLTNKAVVDLSGIWKHSFEKWSEDQADKYYEMLMSTCQKVADNPELGRNYDGITPDLFGIKANRHIIFYRIITEDYIEIIRILYEGMDLRERILE